MEKIFPEMIMINSQYCFSIDYTFPNEASPL